MEFEAQHPQQSIDPQRQAMNANTPSTSSSISIASTAFT